MATVTENDGFALSVLVEFPLDSAVLWISANLEPEDVFSKSKLQEWADSTEDVK